MKTDTLNTVAVLFTLVGCMFLYPLLFAGRAIAASEPVPAAIQSIKTSLEAAACRNEVDPDSADDTHRLRCPGIGDYALIPTVDDVRQERISLVSPEHEEILLSYGKKVPAHDCRLDRTVEWRATNLGGKLVPHALIIHLHAYKAYFEPKTLVHSYWIIAKITSTRSCVTDTILDNKQSMDDIHPIADSAQARPCVGPEGDN